MHTTWIHFSPLLCLLLACGGPTRLESSVTEQIQGEPLAAWTPLVPVVSIPGCEPEGPLGVHLVPLLGSRQQLSLRFEAQAKVDLLGLEVVVDLAPGQRLRIQPGAAAGPLLRGERHTGELGVDLGSAGDSAAVLVRFIGSIVDPEGPGGQSQFQVERQVSFSPARVESQAVLVRLGDGMSLDVPAIHRPATNPVGGR
jgi:hypothetical protein